MDQNFTSKEKILEISDVLISDPNIREKFDRFRHELIDYHELTLIVFSEISTKHENVEEEAYVTIFNSALLLHAQQSVEEERGE